MFLLTFLRFYIIFIEILKKIPEISGEKSMIYEKNIETFKENTIENFKFFNKLHHFKRNFKKFVSEILFALLTQNYL